jgi:solute carrier family 35 (UDP-sugar transporter), member A1/2/3
MNGLKGFLAVVAACFTSGLAGVYFEMVLKNSQADLWVRNLQLSLFSILPALLPVLVSLHTTSSTSIFANFGPWAWSTVLIQVAGGLLTAMVIKYADNILKGFATSLSIVLSFLASVALFDLHLSIAFVVGSLTVLGATWLYNHQGKGPSLSGFLDLARGGHEKLYNDARSPAVEPGQGDMGVLFSSGLRTTSMISLTTLSNSNTPHPSRPGTP